MKAKCKTAMQKAETEDTKEYLSSMNTIKKELNADENYCKKFGLLKKASVLLFYGREKDAKYQIACAATIVAAQRRLDEERQEAI